MRTLAVLILLSGVILSWTPSSAQSSDDSTRLYCTPVWKIRKVVYKAQAADTLIRKQQQEIVQLEGALRSADESNAAARKATQYAIERGDSFEKSVKLEEMKTDEQRRQKNKWKIGCGFAVLVIIGQVVFGG